MKFASGFILLMVYFTLNGGMIAKNIENFIKGPPQKGNNGLNERASFIKRIDSLQHLVNKLTHRNKDLHESEKGHVKSIQELNHEKERDQAVNRTLKQKVDTLEAALATQLLLLTALADSIIAKENRIWDVEEQLEASKTEANDLLADLKWSLDEYDKLNETVTAQNDEIDRYKSREFLVFLLIGINILLTILLILRLRSSNKSPEPTKVIKLRARKRYRKNG